MTPRVSVVMAVKNGERYLSESVESILAQTFGDFEFLIVDDGSDDATPQILSDFADRDPRIKLLRNDQSMGPYPSANRAMERAAGVLIARIDGDDIAAANRLERQVGFLDKHPDHLLVGSGYRSIDEAGRVQFEKFNPMDDFALRWTACFRMPMVHPSFCFRARYPDGSPVRYPEESFAAQDYSLVGDILVAGKAASIGEPLVDYRMHGANISSTRKKDQDETAIKVARRVLNATAGAETCDAFAPFLDVLYGVREPDRPDFAASACAFRALAAGMDDRRQSKWMKRRAAGYLAEAFIRSPNTLAQVKQYIRSAPDFVPSLAFRAMEVKGILAPDGSPGGG